MVSLYNKGDLALGLDEYEMITPPDFHPLSFWAGLLGFFLGGWVGLITTRVSQDLGIGDMRPEDYIERGLSDSDFYGRMIERCLWTYTVSEESMSPFLTATASPRGF